MKRKGIVLIAVVLCILLAAGALFASGAKEGVKEKKPVTVTVWTFLNPEGTSSRERALKEIMDRFHSENPDIKIEVQPQPWKELYTLFMAAAETGTAPDIIWTNQGEAHLRSDLYADLNKLIFDKWPKNEVDAFQKGLWEFNKFGGPSAKAVAIWPNVSQVLYTRKDIFSQAGVDTMKSWDEFRTGMAKVRDLGGSGRKFHAFGMALGGGTTPGAYDSALADLKGNVFDPSTKLPYWTTEESLKSFKMITDLVSEKIMPVDVASQTVDDLGEAFAGGQYAMISGIAARYLSVRGKATWGSENMDFQGFPAWKAADYPGPSWMVSWAPAIWKDSKNLEEAAKVLEAMIDEKGALSWMLTGGQNPMRSTLASHPDFQDSKYDHIRKMGEVSKNGFLSPPGSVYHAPARKIIDQAFASVMIEGSDPKQALDKAMEEYKKLIQ
jgi:ABC-type glycerol-3-phosphate transport system substrate-binding protein